MDLTKSLQKRAVVSHLTADELISAGLGRSTAYAFLRGVNKDYKSSTIDVITRVLSNKEITHEDT